MLTSTLWTTLTVPSRRLKPSNTELCFGTAKIGIQAYGRTKTGLSQKPDELLSAALDRGLTWFDTSPRYGNAESILGRHLADRPDIRISTKIDNLVPGSPDTPDDIMRSVTRSLEALNRQRVDMVYLHQETLEILSDPFVHEGLARLRDSGLASQIGASTYTDEELSYVIATDYFDWVQVACNVLDTSQVTAITDSDRGLKVAARSIYLQGVLLADNSIDSGIPMASEMRKCIEAITDIASSCDLSLPQLATSFVVNHCNVDMVLFGAGRLSNIEAFCENSKLVLPEKAVAAIQDIAAKSKHWTNPKRWNDL